ncbi:HNH endonuclease [Myxococcota bacterium]
MEYPFPAYSWDLLSDNVAIKHMDKSAFVHNGTGIPREIASFFHLPESGLTEPRPVVLQVEDKKYDAQCTMDAVLSRFRLFWRTDFSELIRERFPHFHSVFSSGGSFEGDRPQMHLERIQSDVYRVSFSDPATMPEVVDSESEEWADEELEAAVDAYVMMLRKELEGEPYNKAEVNRSLRTSELSKRSKGSVEFRMQNISAVFQDLCHPIVEGYLPRGNVGTEVSERIKSFIYRTGIVQEDDYAPSGDDQVLERSVGILRSRGISGEPRGRRQPRRQQSSHAVYERDPLVKVWILQNADGVCELCRNRGPFVDNSGQYFLEVHHVVFLADGGPDTIENAVALCPNCHRKCHLSPDAAVIREEIQTSIERIKSC